jgi:hypothetical protein
VLYTAFAVRGLFTSNPLTISASVTPAPRRDSPTSCAVALELHKIFTETLAARELIRGFVQPFCGEEKPQKQQSPPVAGRASSEKLGNS